MLQVERAVVVRDDWVAALLLLFGLGGIPDADLGAFDFMPEDFLVDSDVRLGMELVEADDETEDLSEDDKALREEVPPLSLTAPSSSSSSSSLSSSSITMTIEGDVMMSSSSGSDRHSVDVNDDDNSNPSHPSCSEDTPGATSRLLTSGEDSRLDWGAENSFALQLYLDDNLQATVAWNEVKH